MTFVMKVFSVLFLYLHPYLVLRPIRGMWIKWEYRCDSGAVPATVSAAKRCRISIVTVRIGWEDRQQGVSQETCHVQTYVQCFG